MGEKHMLNAERFRHFVRAFTRLVDAHGANEATMLAERKQT